MLFKNFSTFLINQIIYFNNIAFTLHKKCFFEQNHSQKKRRDTLESRLVRVLITAELEFRKIVVPRLPQNVSTVNIENTGKSKQLYYLCDQLLGGLIYLYLYCSDINLFLIDYAWCELCNKWLLLFDNNTRSLTLEEKHWYPIILSWAVIAQDRIIGYQFEKAN